MLPHLDNKHYNSDIGKRKAAIKLASNIDEVYLVPVLADTIDQLTTTLHRKVRLNDNDS